MYVILDTQAIHYDFYLSNPATRELLEQAPARGIIVCVPEVVLMEMAADFRDKINTPLEALRTAHRQLDKLRRGGTSNAPVVDLEVEVEEYRTRLDAILEQLHVRVLPVPNVDVQELLAKGISRRKPFKKNGQGMFDAVIWASVVQLWREDPIRQIAVITNDTDYADNDLGDEQGARLHPDLLSELNALSIEAISMSGEQSSPENTEGSGLAELHKSVQGFNESWRSHMGRPQGPAVEAEKNE